MIIIAASLYLPEHITTMLSRAWFYYAGDDAAAARGAPGARSEAIPGVAAGRLGSQDVIGVGPRMPGQEVMDMLGAL